MRIQKKYQKAVDEFVRIALEKYRNSIDAIILFGSVAKGEAKEDSDIDILVIWKGNKLEGWDVLEEVAVDILLEYNQYISIKTLHPVEYTGMTKMGSSFIKNIEREGVVLG
jgi:predicted nucleotidyltransferase